MYDTAYARPTTLEEATALLQADEDAICLSGGMTLVPTLKQRLAAPSLIVDLGGVLSRAISVTNTMVIIGAGARHIDVARHDGIRRVLPALADLAGGIGDPMVRNRGTIGGSLANNDPAADYPAAALALRAKVETSQGCHHAADFLTGMFETALQPGEIVTAIRFAVPQRAAYAKFASKASGYALAGAFVAAFADTMQVAITGAGPSVFRATGFEQALSENLRPEALNEQELEAGSLLSDLHADGEYRAALAKEMTRRAVRAMIKDRGNPPVPKQ